MQDVNQASYWFSINIDDSTSEYTNSFGSALNDKSLYIVEKRYYSCSWSGATNYYRYIFHTTDGELAMPSIGSCKMHDISGEGWSSSSSYYDITFLNEYGRKDYRWHYPFSLHRTANIGCAVYLADNKGEVRIIGLNDVKNNFWPLLKDLSRASCWDDFIIDKYLNVILAKADATRNLITKYGYSKVEFAHEYCKHSGYDHEGYRDFFKSDLKFLSLVVPFCNELFSQSILDERVNELNRLQGTIDYIKKVLDNKKPWR